MHVVHVFHLRGARSFGIAQHGTCIIAFLVSVHRLPRDQLTRIFVCTYTSLFTIWSKYFIECSKVSSKVIAFHSNSILALTRGYSSDALDKEQSSKGYHRIFDQLSLQRCTYPLVKGSPTSITSRIYHT